LANQIDPQRKSGQTRRSFLTKMGFGAAAFALIGGSFGIFGLRDKQKNSKIQDFPGEDSIFHPARDPRQDPRRS